MASDRVIKIPGKMYSRAVMVQSQFLAKGKRVPLWACLQMKEEKDPDDILRRIGL